LNKSKTVLYLGSNGFPFGMAAIQRQLQIAKAIQNQETRVMVISRKGVHPADRIRLEKIGTSGSFEEISYVYASGTPLYVRNFWVRNFLKVIGLVGELGVMFYQRIFNRVTCMVVNSTSLTQLRYYYFISRFVNTRLVYDYVEYMSSLDDRSMKTSGDRKNFDTQFFNYADALIIISPFLEQHIKQVAPKIPSIRIPPIIDFEKFARINFKPTQTNYFLFCGATQYLDVIEFIIKAYQKSTALNHGVSLILIINGDLKKMDRLKDSVQEDSTIEILSNLSYEALIGYYKNARALLIPLQDNLQDMARFPFKISEYTAAARPIVTTNYGAVAEYFQDGVNALLAEPQDVDGIAAKLNYILSHPDEADQIGQNGHKLGLQLFNYKAYAAPLQGLIGST
jgi:glycosyltransferase involved in cell wall biosynthesis